MTIIQRWMETLIRSTRFNKKKARGQVEGKQTGEKEEREGVKERGRNTE